MASSGLQSPPLRAVAELQLHSSPASPSKRKLSSFSSFPDITALCDAILQGQVKLAEDSLVEIKKREVVVGLRGNIPFIVEPSDIVIGKGNFGVVHKGRLYRHIDQEWKTDSIAIKTPLPPEEQDESAWMREEDEDDSIDNLAEFIWEEQVHKLIGKVDYVQQLLLTYRINDSIALVSHLRDGTSKLITKKPFCEKVRMFKNIAIALNQLKEKGFYYTDVKPQNVLTNGSELEIVDLSSICHLLTISDPDDLGAVFGRVIDAETGEIYLARSFKYMSKENWDRIIQALKESMSDYENLRALIEELIIYALLMTAYEVIVGELPSECPNRAVCFHAGLEKNPIKDNADAELIDSGCPKGLAEEFVTYLKKESPLSFPELIQFLAKCQESTEKDPQSHSSHEQGMRQPLYHQQGGDRSLELDTLLV